MPEHAMATVYLHTLADLFESKQIRSADLTVAQREAINIIVIDRELVRQQQRAEQRASRRRRAA
jgi:hypothetical protein